MAAALLRLRNCATRPLQAGNGDPVVGRDEEIDRVTTIAEGLAQRMATRGSDLPGDLAGACLVELSVGKMLAGTRYRGAFEDRVAGVVADAEASGVVLFVDEIHMLVGAGRTTGSKVDASDILKPALARGRLRCLGATTHDEYQQYFATDKAFERRFQKVHVAEPTQDATADILRRLKPSYEHHHGLHIQDDALLAAVRLAARYLTDRHFPDKAIDLVDEACATARLRHQHQHTTRVVVGPEHIAQVVSKWTGIPATRLGQDERRRLLELPERLRQRVVGQDEAVSAVADAVVRSRSGLGNPKQPSGSFLFLGATGLAKALAEQLFGDDKHLVRIDMSEYVDHTSVARLIGAPPGVVLLDEVEKGDDAVTNLFLQILDDGRLTDSKGRTVDFTNTIIIMTSNLGEHHLTGGGGGCDVQHQRVIADVQRKFRPELINRLDETVVFRPLSGDAMREVVKLQVAGIAARLADSGGIGLDVTDAAAGVVLSRSSGEVAMYGARPIKRCLQSMVMTRISRMMVQGEVEDGCHISIDAAADDMEEAELVFKVKKPEKIIMEAPPPPPSPASVKDAEISSLDTNNEPVKDCNISAFDANERVLDKTGQVKPASVKDCKISVLDATNEPVLDKARQESSPLTKGEVKRPASALKKEPSSLTRKVARGRDWSPLAR
ncbi:hypothetical protein HU200_067165 [Digitaria exilis]|uniref:Clp ATPase C-terminal domain-containing protein n=1 Tax=Digitaria exilis TaxID=1010633 RepID=A0A835DSC5_9POAL|nr:hypothetical protein HU200_067165 [Digitaria exilis]